MRNCKKKQYGDGSIKVGTPNLGLGIQAAAKLYENQPKHINIIQIKSPTPTPQA
jgi:hypothetical protein